MSDKIEKLREWGCDVEDARKRLLEDDGFYRTCLDIFTGDESFEKLDASMDNQYYKEAFEAAHTLKGVSGNLGLTPLYEALCLLVEALRGDRCKEAEQYYVQVRLARDTFFKIMGEES